MDQHKTLLDIVKSRTKSRSIVAELAAVLNISYDAAHRRISGKSKFSLEEGIIICQRYNLSFDQIFMPGSRVLAEKTKEIRSAAGIADYFKQSIGILSSYKNSPGAKMYYSAKDIPLFYIIGDSLLSKFKLHVWLGLLAAEVELYSFDNFVFQGPVFEYGKVLRDINKNFEVYEIWNDTTINSTLQQIYYYYSAGYLNLQHALSLLNEVETVLQHVEKRSGAANNRYYLYYNELLILNNNVLVCSADQKALFIPYNILGYFITYDEETCVNTESFFKQQLKHSMPLNNSSMRDRKLFFNRGSQKINHYRHRIEGDAGLLL